jgi:hypothetical protein
MSDQASLLDLLARFAREGVEYVLIGGQAVRLNGFLRSTEDIDVLLRPGRDNGVRVIRALNHLPSSSELDPAWFDPAADEPESIRVADELLVDLLFNANGQTWESVQPWVQRLDIDGVPVQVLDIDGLLRTKTTYREKDILDRQALMRLRHPE